MVEHCKSLRPNDIDLEGSARDKVGKEVMGKRMRQIADCYPQEGRETRENQADWVTGQTKKRRARRVKAQQMPAESGTTQHMPAESGRTPQEGRSASISDGCIAHWNRVIQQELSLQEVRQLITAGRRLGMQFQGNEEEVESRFLELEQRDERVGGNGEEEGTGTVFVKLEEFTGDGYLGIKGVWGSKEEQCVFVNVYALSDRRSKAELWDELSRKITEEGGRWLLARDYNAVRCLEEKRGRTGMSVDMSEFDAFIETTGLVDFKLANRKFTWYRPDGTSMSRLDRILMTVEMSSMGEEWVQQGLRRDISDHCAIVLKTRVTDWGPKPFRVLDIWQQHPDFKKVVEGKWIGMVVDGFAGYRCLQKLKMLKKFLKGWNKEVFGDVEVQFQAAVDKVARIDMKNEVADLEGEEVAERQEGFHEMWDIMKKREILWKQKSRCSWAKLGDANTRFFHKVANGRKVHNNINGFACEGKWVEEPKEVKKEVVRYFSKMFDGESWQRPKPVEINFNQISKEKKEELERPFSVEEIEEGLKSCEGTKAPGPDGFNFNFLKCVWNCLKEDFMRLFEEFHQNGRIGFGMKWRGWIRECLSTARISVLVNGSPTEEFVMGRGLRQGDPLSPFLFLIVAEGLNGLVRRAETEGMLHGPAVGNKGLTISLLQFANDMVILGNADSENIFAVKTILRCFELMSRLRINFSKSSVVGYNVSERWIKGATSVLHCGVGETSFMYLGLPVGGKIRCKKMWELVLKKFRAKLAIWKSSTLSFGDRITLLNLYSTSFLVGWGGVKAANSLGKWWFRLGDGVEGLWKKVVREKYYGGREEVDITALESVRVSRIWRDIIGIGQRSGRLQDMLVKGFKWVVGEGCRVGFWRSVWVGEKALRDLCPRLFELAVNKKGLVSEMGGWEASSWRWNIIWRRGRFGREKDEELMLWEVLSRVGIKVGVEDRWQWIHVSDGKYVVKQAYEFLESTKSILNDWLCKLIWCRLVPSKVSFFGWRLCLQRLPTKWNLQKRGVVLEGGLMCGLCTEEVEDINHVFCTCKEVWLIWVMVLSWWGFEVVLPDILEGVAEIFLFGLGKVVGKELGASLFLVTSWYIWYGRNCRVFKGDVALREGLLAMI
ncbi:hypothetical protein SLEP1_g28164 [Rubroshorea leprosula]|uniref:Reverse transcriptase domain-containing protein n=1 Tax=Rubroshorea leprosula TaxID=152421 RepID=A0AAV5K584_9ROSI|nr:hypothetical protein SLEP1_g28164 [Rubroshorea leprosula]